MNKYCIKEFLSNTLESHESTLKETSFDKTNNEYLCEDEKLRVIYDFDSYVRQNFDQRLLPASPDAIYVGNKKLYFIEFKNQNPSDIDKSQMKRKFESGTKILKEELLNGFCPKDVEYIFCVVYKKPRARYFNPYAIESNIPKFGLEEKNEELGHFYSKIITEPVEFYKEEFAELDC